MSSVINLLCNFSWHPFPHPSSFFLYHLFLYTSNSFPISPPTIAFPPIQRGCLVCRPSSSNINASHFFFTNKIFAHLIKLVQFMEALVAWNNKILLQQIIYFIYLSLLFSLFWIPSVLFQEIIILVVEVWDPSRVFRGKQYPLYLWYLKNSNRKIQNKFVTVKFLPRFYCIQ